MLKEMKINMPKIIIFNENYDFLILKPVEERFKKITNYIVKNYMVDGKINNWVIYKKK